jgi:hypothetical protein
MTYDELQGCTLTVNHSNEELRMAGPTS